MRHPWKLQKRTELCTCAEWKTTAYGSANTAVLFSPLNSDLNPRLATLPCIPAISPGPFLALGARTRYRQRGDDGCTFQCATASMQTGPCPSAPTQTTCACAYTCLEISKSVVMVSRGCTTAYFARPPCARRRHQSTAVRGGWGLYRACAGRGPPRMQGGCALPGIQPCTPVQCPKQRCLAALLQPVHGQQGQRISSSAAQIWTVRTVQRWVSMGSQGATASRQTKNMSLTRWKVKRRGNRLPPICEPLPPSSVLSP